jgi:hypothetical protein
MSVDVGKKMVSFSEVIININIYEYASSEMTWMHYKSDVSPCSEIRSIQYNNSNQT